MDSNRREHYRIIYPVDERPKLIFQGKGREGEEYEVMDISENGVRIKRREGSEFQLESKAVAKIIFHDNESVVIEGEVYRVEAKEAVLSLATSIKYSLIMREQRRLMNLGYLGHI